MQYEPQNKKRYSLASCVEGNANRGFYLVIAGFVLVDVGLFLGVLHF